MLVLILFLHHFYSQCLSFIQKVLFRSSVRWRHIKLVNFLFTIQTVNSVVTPWGQAALCFLCVWSCWLPSALVWHLQSCQAPQELTKIPKSTTSATTSCPSDNPLFKRRCSSGTIRIRSAWKHRKRTVRLCFHLQQNKKSHQTAAKQKKNRTLRNARSPEAE